MISTKKKDFDIIKENIFSMRTTFSHNIRLTHERIFTKNWLATLFQTIKNRIRDDSIEL